MKKRIPAVSLLLMILALAGCGGGGNSSSPTVVTPPVVVTPSPFVTYILSNQAIDGDITPTNTFPIVHGQSVVAGVDPSTSVETRAFLHFPLTGAGGVPGSAVISSATLDILINSIQTKVDPIPIRIDLVDFQPPLIVSDFDRASLPAQASIATSIYQTDFNKHVVIDVTVLMREAQRLGLLNFQIRILEDLVVVPPGIIAINDTTGVNRATDAPLLTVNYF